MQNMLLFVSNMDLPMELVQVFKQAGFRNIVHAKSGSEARRLSRETIYTVAIVNAPLIDEFGNDLSLSLVENNITNVVLLVKSDIQEMVESKLDDSGILVLPKPVSTSVLYRSLTIFKAVRVKLEKLLDQNMKLEDKVSELKLVDRAKCLLIMYKNFDEEEAHKHIEKTAMDQRRTRKEIAQSIIDMYINNSNKRMT